MFFSDFDECDSNPCQNGGTCTDHLNGYSCSCVQGFNDDDCQTGQLFIPFAISKIHIS